MLPTLATVMPDRGRAGRGARRAAIVLAAGLLAAAAVAMLRPPGAAASASQLSVMQDDDQLLYRGDFTRDFTLKRMKSIGVDVVRVTVLWKNVTADAFKTKARSKRFKGDDPKTYPKSAWDPYDRLVRACKTLGIIPLLNITGPGPRKFMGRTKDKKIAGSYRPNSKEFYKFVKAVGTRYSGTYRDEDDDRLILPKVFFWSLWNEPNQPAWLSPQFKFDAKLHRNIPYSPVLYRELYLRGRLALSQSGHAKDFVYAGETAPTGSGLSTPHSTMRPALFVRELFCLTAGGSEYSGRAAAARHCSQFQDFAAGGGFAMSGWAHHAYTKALPPNRRDPHRDSITLANIRDLERLLDNVATTTGLIKPDLPIAITEFGYETKPPDPFNGVPWAVQAARINQADEIAFHDPRIATTAQFLLQDQRAVRSAKRGTRAYWFNYQSGLVYSTGKPKPSLTAYALPFNITDSANGLYDAWGQLRFLPYLTGATHVLLQFRPAGSPDWRTITSLTVTNPLGFFENASVIPQGPGVWRALWLNTPGQGPAYIASREALVTR